MLRVKKDCLFPIVLFLLPMGVSGLGLGSASDFGANISMADFFFIALAGYLVPAWGRYRPRSAVQRRIEGQIVKFDLLFLYLAAISIWNMLRFGGGDVRAAFLSLLKLLVCFAYSYVFMLYLRSCSQEGWQRFVAAAVLSGFVFSLSCILGVALYVAKGLQLFTVYGGRASGFQTDPNLSAIFQLMSLSYTLIWMRFTKRRKLGIVVLLCLVAGTVLTASKAGILTLAVCAVMILFLAAISGAGKFTLKLISLTVMAIGATAFLASRTRWLDLVLARLAELFSGDVTVVLTERDLLWKAVLDTLLADPLNLIFGVGIGQFETVAGRYGIRAISYSVHNTLLSFLVECGFAMPLIVVAVLGVLLYRLVRNSIERKDRCSLYMSWGISAIAIFMNSLNFQNSRMAYVFITFVYVSMKRIEAGELAFAGAGALARGKRSAEAGSSVTAAGGRSWLRI